MNKKLNYLKILFSLLFIIFILTNNVSAYTIDNGNYFFDVSDSLSSLQNIIDSSISAGKTIFFNSGNYNWIQNLNITKSINLAINGSGLVNFIGNNKVNGININSSNVNISGINFNNYLVAMNLNKADYTNINNNIINSNNSTGITITNSNNVIIENNKFYEKINPNNRYPNKTAINMTNSNDSRISNNEIYTNNSNGIGIKNSNNLDINNNQIHEINNQPNTLNGQFLQGITWENSNGNIENNNISGYFLGIKMSDSYIKTTIKNNDIHHNSDSGMTMTNSGNFDVLENIIRANGRPGVGNGLTLNNLTNILVKNNIIKDNFIYGIVSGSLSNNITISENNISNSSTGIYSTKTSQIIINENNIFNLTSVGIFSTGNNQVIISGNNISNLATGIYSLETSQLTIDANNILNLSSVGIYFGQKYMGDNDITVKNNIIDRNIYGIYLPNQEYVRILNNTISNSSNYGIYLYANGNDTAYNNISGNTIVNNGYGIVLYGLSGIVKNNDINYNRIVNKIQGLGVFGSSSDNLANFNWWGNNTPKTDFNGVNLSVWYVIELIANDFNTTYNASTNITSENLNLSYRFTTNIEIENDKSNLPYFEITFIGPNGEVSTLDIRANPISYLVNNNATYSIRGLSDNEDVLLTINFLSNSTQNNTNPNNTNPNNTNPNNTNPNNTNPNNTNPNNTNPNNTNPNNTNPDNISPGKIDSNIVNLKKTGIPILSVLFIVISVGITIKRKK